MTYSLIALYNHPEDTEAFDRHYAETHSKLALDFPGVRSFTGTHPGPDPEGTRPPYYFIVVVGFDDQATHDAALGGPEGQAAVADLENFAGAGVTIVSGPTISYQ